MSEEKDNLPLDHTAADGSPENPQHAAEESAKAMAAEHEEASVEDEIRLTPDDSAEAETPALEAEADEFELADAEAAEAEPAPVVEESPKVEDAPEVEAASEEELAEPLVASEEPLVASEEPFVEPVSEPETESETSETGSDVQVEEEPEPASETENTIELTPEQLADDTPVIEDNSDLDVMESIAETTASESEDETLRHELPMEDYEKLSMDDLVLELEKLLATDRVMSVKDHVEEIRKSFLSKYHHFIDEKRDEWHAENPDSTEDFHYHYPLKTRFDQLLNQYRDRKNAHFKQLQGNLESNLKTRLALVEELKNLINPTEDLKDTLKHFNDIRERWKNAGPIPKDKYNHVWNNYHFHVENFYDYLHLDREARDIDFKHNLEQKQRIIARVEELVHEPDINKSFRELQDLHKIWKEDIGPVSREYREQIWNQFSDLTKQMHDKREAHLEKLRGTETENLEAKRGIIAKINELAQEKVHSHGAWQQQIEKVEALRNDFFSTGKVPADVNETTWTAFKDAVRAFNGLKNSFYKEVKKDQNDNLSRKQALVARAQTLKDSDDFAATTPVMKQIQDEWKTIGHVPRKFSDKLWAEFKAACNQYFERLKESRNAESPEETQAFENKKNYLDQLRDFQLTGEHRVDLDAIKKHIENWKGFGKVPFPKRHIEGKFNKVLDALFEKLSLSKKETDMVRFNNRVTQLAGSDDSRKLDNEKIFLMRKIDEVQGEIFQLENNIQFFTSKDKNPKKENPMVVEVRRNIEKHKEELLTLREKLKQLRDLKSE